MAYNFDDNDRVKSNWWQKKTVGDKIQGTFVSKRKIMNQLSGKEQMVYVLLLENGEYWNVGGSVAIDSQMEHIRPGQIIEFRFVSEIPSKRPGLNATKVVHVFTKKDLVNDKWLQEQAEQGIAADFGGTVQGNIDVNKIDFGGGATAGNKPVAGANTEEEKLNLIGNLAIEKLKVTDPANVELAIAKATKLALIPENYDEIIAKLKSL